MVSSVGALLRSYPGAMSSGASRIFSSNSAASFTSATTANLGVICVRSDCARLFFPLPAPMWVSIARLISVAIFSCVVDYGELRRCGL